jgi:hypothetical protein
VYVVHAIRCDICVFPVRKSHSLVHALPLLLPLSLSRALSNGINSAVFFCFFEAIRGNMAQRVAHAQEQWEAGRARNREAAAARQAAGKGWMREVRSIGSSSGVGGGRSSMSRSSTNLPGAAAAAAAGGMDQGAMCCVVEEDEEAGHATGSHFILSHSQGLLAAATPLRMGGNTAREQLIMTVKALPCTVENVTSITGAN